MKSTRGVSGDRLIRTLQRVGYSIVRQMGSHVRLLHPGAPVHAVTIPRHDPLKAGTLHGIPAEAVLMRSITVESLARLLDATRRGCRV